jgi:prepilin-type N-terminal cleavage/methylation domain-containing protein/prepilin-type processing-associated H-X9-DG protein
MESRRGFTLVELLTTASVLLLLIGITLPALVAVRRYGRRVVGIHNQREIVFAVTLYACDNDDDFPSSVALCRSADAQTYRWQDPRKVKTTEPLATMPHNSMAGYLAEYAKNADIFQCPSSPAPHTYWQQAWEQADQWHHPELEDADAADPLFGSYCFFWNYVAYLEGPLGPFVGPRSQLPRADESNLLVCDYFGYDDWRNRGAFGSCEPFKHDEIVAEFEWHSSYWSYRNHNVADDPRTLATKLNAGYVDGHVAGYTPAQASSIRVSETPDGQEPYSESDPLRNPGCFFIPTQATRAIK